MDSIRGKAVVNGVGVLGQTGDGDLCAGNWMGRRRIPHWWDSVAMAEGVVMSGKEEDKFVAKVKKSPWKGKASEEDQSSMFTGGVAESGALMEEDLEAEGVFGVVAARHHIRPMRRRRRRRRRREDRDHFALAGGGGGISGRGADMMQDMQAKNVADRWTEQNRMAEQMTEEDQADAAVGGASGVGIDAKRMQDMQVKNDTERWAMDRGGASAWGHTQGDHFGPKAAGIEGCEHGIERSLCWGERYNGGARREGGVGRALTMWWWVTSPGVYNVWRLRPGYERQTGQRGEVG